MKPFYAPYYRLDGTWRISKTFNGFEVDVCGAIDAPTARAQCVIFNLLAAPL